MIDLDLEGTPDLSDDTERERWRIRSDREATWALRKLAVALAEVRRVGQDAADETDAIKAWKEAALAGPTRDATFFEQALVAYRVELEERDPDLPKTYKVPGGTIARRKQPDTIRVTDEHAFVAWALEHRPEAVKIEPRVSGLRDFAASGGAVIDENGAIVPGVERTTGQDAYSAKPA